MNSLIAVLTSDTETEEDDNLPSYNDPGRILFKFFPIPNEKPEIEVLAYDGSAFWLNRGGFPDYWIQDSVDIKLEGHYVLEGITGHGWKDYFGEYDEEWYFAFCRRASEDEIQSEALF